MSKGFPNRLEWRWRRRRFFKRCQGVQLLVNPLIRIQLQLKKRSTRRRSHIIQGRSDIQKEKNPGAHISREQEFLDLPGSEVAITQFTDSQSLCISTTSTKHEKRRSDPHGLGTLPQSTGGRETGPYATHTASPGSSVSFSSTAQTRLCLVKWEDAPSISKSIYAIAFRLCNNSLRFDPAIIMLWRKTLNPEKLISLHGYTVSRWQNLQLTPRWSTMPSKSTGFGLHSQLLTMHSPSPGLMMQHAEHSRGEKRDLVKFNYVLVDSSDFWNLKYMPFHRWLTWRLEG